MSAQALIDTSIVQLQRLSSYLVDELGELRERSQAGTVEARACKEILLSITVLIPKLQAARYVVGEAAANVRCAGCEEG
jgi:hypothetical protein